MTAALKQAAPRERPILFSGQMVRAILDGRKTQTRRVVKDHVPRGVDSFLCHPLAHFEALNGGRSVADLRCPHGQPGERLWVRETWQRHGWPVAGTKVTYRADYPSMETTTGWRPSIFMPRWACRLELELTSVRVERLQDISEEDAKAEGAEAIGITFQEGRPGIVPSLGSPYRDGFRILWSSINGAESWDANPWVWCLGLRRVG